MRWTLTTAATTALPDALEPEFPTLPGSYWRCVTGVDAAGRPAGCGYLSGELHGQPQQPGELFVRVAVLPDFRWQGLGSLLYSRLLNEAAAAGVSRLHTSVGGNDVSARAFAERRGFTFAYEMLEAELDLGAAPPAIPAPPATVPITSLAEEPEREAVLRELYILDRTLSSDVPQWAGHMPPFEQYAEQLLACDPEAILFARDGGRLVALSFTRVEEDGLTGYTDFLGVLPSHRRHGLALAMKRRTLTWARRRGLSRLMTHNNAASCSIIQLNRKLGYVTRSSTIYLTKTAGGAPTHE